MKIPYMLLVSALFVFGTAMAEDNRSNQRSAVMTGDFMATIPAQSVSVDSLVGSDVISRVDNETIGEVEDIIIDQDGNLVGVIVSVGGFLGIGEKDVALDWDHVDLVPGDENGLFDGRNEILGTTDEPARTAALSNDGQRHEMNRGDWDPDDYVLVVNVSQDTLENAPEFDREGWGDF